jgi:2-desacetyl-2-hydroxyethyl bacteriochlorophyllide A dehydrogenase
MDNGSASMKAVICEQPGCLTVVERPKPERGPGEVLLKIRRVGLCGTDYHIFAGNQPYFEYPRIIGHELAGHIEDADAPFERGQVVTVNPYLPCGSCIACRKGKPNCCSSISVLGVHADGGLCEYLAVPESAVVPVGKLSLDDAALVEFLAVGAHAVRRAGPMRGDRMLVVGAGPIGIAVALAARFEGADVTLSDTSADRLAYASAALGFTSVVPVGDDMSERLAELTGGEFFDTVFDATGNIAAMNAGIAFVAHGGTYVLVSVVMDDLVFPDPEFHKRETTLMGSRNATRADFELVIQRLADGSIPAQALRTQSFPALDTGTHIVDLIANQGSVLKAVAAF